MFKGFVTLEDKKKLILSLCNLYKRKENIKEINLKELSESIVKHCEQPIETDEDIQKISQHIKRKLGLTERIPNPKKHLRIVR